MKALSLTIQKLLPMVNVLQTNKLTDRQTDKWMGKKLYAPNLSMWGHRKTLMATLKASYDKTKQYTTHSKNQTNQLYAAKYLSKLNQPTVIQIVSA